MTISGGALGRLATSLSFQQAAVKQADLKCGFLGHDCDRLTPGAQGQFDLCYVNSSANWRQ